MLQNQGRDPHVIGGNGSTLLAQLTEKPHPVANCATRIGQPFLEDPYCNNPPFGSSSGGITTAAATRSPGSICSRRTPCALRPDSRIVPESMRMILPYWLISISSDFSVTCAMPETLPLRSVVLTLITPEPPRPCRRYSSAGVRLP